MKTAKRQQHLLATIVLLICSAQNNLLAQALTHGPLVGAVTESSARFYVRVAPSANARVRLALAPDFSDALLAEAIATDSTRDFAALLTINNLQPDQLYYYQALVNNVPAGEVRSFKTFPQVGTRAPFRFAFGSCVVNRAQPSATDGRVFEVMAQDEPSFFLQIGDWTYPDSTESIRNPQRVFSADLARIQASYRSKYDSVYAVQKILRTTPIAYVYDDHDYLNNDASATSYPRPESLLTVHVAPEARVNSIRAYQELFPGYALANAQGGIWHKFTFGNADFFMLDTRSQRSPNLNAFVHNATTDSVEFAPPADHSMLAADPNLPGENQMDWLLRELQSSQADWKFIASTVPFNRGLRGAIDLSVSLQDSTVFLPGQPPQSLLNVALGLSDKWVGFPDEQERVLRFIDDHQIKNVIVLSGDTHTAAIDDGANGGLPEIMAGALEQANSRLAFLLQLFGFNIWNGGGQFTSFNDAYGRVTVFGPDSVHLEIIDELGTRIAHKTLRGESTNAVAEHVPLPASVQLTPSYPNPFSPAREAHATLRYELRQNSLVTVSVFDMMGRKISQHALGRQDRGAHEYRWEGKDERGEFLANGVYFLQLHFMDSRERVYPAALKVVLLR